MPTQITPLPIRATLAIGESTITPTLIFDETQAILVDAGLPGCSAQIIDAMRAAGVPPERLTHIVITHADMDHVGGLAELVRLCPAAEVLCHEKERPFVEADVPPLRLFQMESSLNQLTGEKLVQMSALVKNLRENFKKLGVNVTRTLADGEALPCGVRALAAPGHTPGHLCLFVEESKTLVAGDALTIENGELVPGPEYLAYNLVEFKESLKKLKELGAQRVICYHGGEYNRV